MGKFSLPGINVGVNKEKNLDVLINTMVKYKKELEYIMLNLDDININSLSANKITAGTIDADIIDVTNLNASNIETGTLRAIDIKACDIFASRFYNDEETGYLDLGDFQGYPELNLYSDYGSSVESIFRIYDYTNGILMSSYDNQILYTQDQYIFPQNNWDFGDATITGLTAVFA